LVRVLSAGVVSSKAPISLQVEDFPAFVVVDDKGNDFFSKWIP
jgi:fumarate hydratase class I